MFEHPNLLVLGPPMDQVFLMKLSASRAPDVSDMVVLWPLCGFADADDVVNQPPSSGGPTRSEARPDHAGSVAQTTQIRVRDS